MTGMCINSTCVAVVWRGLYTTYCRVLTQYVSDRRRASKDNITGMKWLMLGVFLFGKKRKQCAHYDAAAAELELTNRWRLYYSVCVSLF